MQKLLAAFLFATSAYSQITATGSGSQSVTLKSTTPITCGAAGVQVTCTAPSPTITLPIEIFGPAGTKNQVTLNLTTAPPAGTLLWLQVHGLRYDAEASVQVNTSAWLPLASTDTAVTLQGNAKAFGGIGGGFSTVSMTVALPTGSLTAGANVITFQFNGSDGVSSGYRVLALNFLQNGTQIIPASTFVQANPTTWTPPLNDPTDIAAGKTLWSTATLTDPASGASVPIKAHCSDCHAVDGRDLKYFNYSNQAIITRAQFHGLSTLQGEQLASYIRSLTTPAPGLPWNPPYQPGPGLDAQPVTSWSAGAGLSNVLANDAAMLAAIAPGGSTTGWAAVAYLNPRQTPIALQLPDWNSWLPQVWPGDAYANFTTNAAYTDYVALRATLAPSNATAYKAALFPFQQWGTAVNSVFIPSITPATDTQQTRQQRYSVVQWQMTKSWELFQTFNLEGIPPAVFPKPALRSWYSGNPFNTAPNIIKLSSGPGLGNGAAVLKDYLSMAWYHLQLILNAGQGTEMAHSPVDNGYVQGFIKELFTIDTTGLGGMMFQLEWLVKCLQEFTLTGNNPSVGANGWHVINTSPATMVNFNWWPMWSLTPAATIANLATAYTQAWFNQAKLYTPANYISGGWTTATENPATQNYSQTMSGQVWYMLPRLRFAGVPASLTTQIAAWAAAIWPAGNWAANNAATCTTIQTCTSGI
jgi:hypothetical protein